MPAAAATLILVACLNVSILLLARGTSRMQELAIRHAIGASRKQLLTQLLTESMILAIAGAAIGIGIAYGSVRLMLKWLPPGTLPLPLAGEAVHINGAVLLFSVAAAIITALIFGLWPAWNYSQPPIETVRK